MDYLSLFISLPTKASSGRMRVWRSLKSLGCAALRDGVYLLPDTPENATALEKVAAETQDAQGNADIYRLAGYEDGQLPALKALFDRSADYAKLAEDIRALGNELKTLDGPAALRRLQSLVRSFEQTARIDFYPAESQRQTAALLDELREEISRHFSPDEPTARQASIPRLDRADYQGRTWATRARPWVDRLASAWLIRRHIDPQAQMIWLATPTDCQAAWLGFDFDGATFSHVGSKVTFETLLASFGLDSDPALAKLGELVHCLDVGGLPVADAAGIETLLAGLRSAYTDDDALLAEASKIFDLLLLNYQEKNNE